MAGKQAANAGGVGSVHALPGAGPGAAAVSSSSHTGNGEGGDGGEGGGNAPPRLPAAEFTAAVEAKAAAEIARLETALGLGVGWAGWDGNDPSVPDSWAPVEAEKEAGIADGGGGGGRDGGGGKVSLEAHLLSRIHSTPMDGVIEAGREKMLAMLTEASKHDPKQLSDKRIGKAAAPPSSGEGSSFGRALGLDGGRGGSTAEEVEEREAERLTLAEKQDTARPLHAARPMGVLSAWGEMGSSNDAKDVRADEVYTQEEEEDWARLAAEIG